MMYWLCCTLNLHIACSEKRTIPMLLEAAQKEHGYLSRAETIVEEIAV